MDAAKLWQNFVDTVTKHYVDFNGRVGRAQFWWYVLVSFVLGFAVGIVAGIIHLPLLSSLFSLALLLPNLGMGVRRLHDVGKPGIYVLLPLVPAVLAMVFFFMLLWPVAMLCWLAVLAAAILLIYWYCQPGDAGDNAYGSPPAPFAP
jgi:uncharacterized membrane protein YhaH (DUF805 family)